MASKIELVEYICEQLRGAGNISYRRMFGEYGLHLDGKYVGAICGDRLFIKPTQGGRAVLITPDEQPPYEGAGVNYFLIEDVEDKEALVKLLKATWADLPYPKPKKPKEGKK